MNAKPAHSSASLETPSLDADAQERSSIRPCQPRPSAAERSSETQKGSSEPLTRSERIDQKVRLAKVLLADLPPLDPRTRLLTTAIVRRDEVLIDGVISTLLPQTTDRT